MTEAAGADGVTSDALSRLVDGINGIGRASRISGYAEDSEQVIEPEVLSHSPGDHVIRAGRVAADSQSTQKNFVRAVETNATAEHVDPADSLVFHRIVHGSKGCFGTSVC